MLGQSPRRSLRWAEVQNGCPAEATRALLEHKREPDRGAKVLPIDWSALATARDAPAPGAVRIGDPTASARLAALRLEEERRSVKVPGLQAILGLLDRLEPRSPMGPALRTSGRYGISTASGI